MRDSFIFYSSFSESLNELDDAMQLTLYKAITGYALSGVEPNLTGVEKAIFKLIKPQLDANNKRFENGCKGGRPKKNQEETEEKPNENQKITNDEPNDNVNDNVNVNVIKENNNLTVITKESKNPKEEQLDIEEYLLEKEKELLPAKQKRFKKPTLEEVEDYIHEKGLSVDAEKFFNYFSEGDWTDSSGKKVKNWKQKLITWDGRGQKSNVGFAKPRMSKQEEIEQHNLKCLAETFGYGEGFENGF
jgi:hypothetical protein